jgi:hypothetical protein
MNTLRISPAGLFWLAMIALASALILLGSTRSVTGAYRTAATAWTRGEPIYQTQGRGFVYLPQAAVLFTPITGFPDALGEILWRCLTIGCFALGFARLAALAGDVDRTRFLYLSLLAGLLAADCARNGQSTLLMGGLMMLASADLAHQRFGRAALWLSLGLAVKPLSVVMLLLAAALYAPLRWRLGLGVLAVCLFPFLTQEPAYVWEQYQAAGDELRLAAALGYATDCSSLFGSLRVFGLAVPAGWMFGANLTAALAVLGLAWRAKRHFPAAPTCLFLYALSACYILLFNPRTENNTYALLGPALALSLHGHRRSLRCVGHLLIASGIAGCYYLGRIAFPAVPPVWVAPWCCTCYLCLLLLDFRLHSSAQRHEHATGSWLSP